MMPDVIAQQNEMQALISVMQQAISNPEIPVERMEKLLNMALDASERMDATRAKKAYASAMAQFKRNPPKIVKDAHVRYETDKGVTEYDHATLGALCEAVIAGLAAVGIYHDWKLISEPDKRIKVTCILTHEMGHKEEFPSIPAFADTSGGKNAIQANQSTVTYLQRSTLFAATGLAALAPPDRDGRDTGDADDKGVITEQQAADMKALLTEVNANIPNFLRWAKAESIERITARNFKSIMAAIEEKRSGK
jgi:hypothetical protein